MVFEKNLTAMVKGIRAHRGKEAEYINACLQEIQKEVGSKNLNTKSTAVLKLAYLNMMGYDMSLATFAIVEVMSHSRFGIKRPGYLAASMAFGENTEVGLLTINLFKKDLGSRSQYEAGLALSCLSSICTQEISRAMLGDIMAMLTAHRAYLRKKAVLCLYRVVLKDSMSLVTCFPKLKERLGDEDQGVLTASVNTFLELARKNAKNYLSLVPQLYHLLVNTNNNWLCIKLLKVFQLLCPLEPRLPAKMCEPLMSLLNTTKAQSVEFEAIRCTVRTMPEGTALMALAVEKLQNFLNSSDRNLRFLALELYKEVLDRPDTKDDKLITADLHTKVLQSIEESDTTARKIALLLLDRIVTEDSFADTVKKLMEFSKKAPSDEFVGTILRMGSRDRYALVQDFAWYLLVLAEMGQHLDSNHAPQIAEQFVDITVRVPGVRPYAVTLALSLLDRSPASEARSTSHSQEGQPGNVDVANAVVGAFAWVIGEYHADIEAPREATVLKAVRSLLEPRQAHSLEPSVQTQCIWSATKLYIASGREAPEALPEIRDILQRQLPVFAQSTHVDVSERAVLVLHLLNQFEADCDKVAAAMPIFGDPLQPVAQGAQAEVAVPQGLNLDEDFFAPEVVPKETFAPIRADPADPYQLASTYKDDLGFLAARDAEQRASMASSGLNQQAQSMYYLQGGKSDSATGASADAAQAGGQEVGAQPLDPLAQMREKLEASRAAAPAKYEVNRSDFQPPARPVAAVSSGAACPSSPPASATSLQCPPQAELNKLQGRLWSVSYRGDHLCLYLCARSRNNKKQLLQLDLRCERVVADAEVAISNVTLTLPPEFNAGEVSLFAGVMPERSPKVAVQISLGPLATPAKCILACELSYSLGDEIVKVPVQLQLPPSALLAGVAMTEDDVAAYIADHQAELLSEQSGQVASLATPAGTAEEVVSKLPALVGLCAGLCGFSGIRPSSSSQPGKSHKFLLVAQPFATESSTAPLLDGQVRLPENARIICLCALIVQDGSLDVKLTVKSCRKDVSDDVCGQLLFTMRELLDPEGRLVGTF